MLRVRDVGEGAQVGEQGQQGHYGVGRDMEPVRALLPQGRGILHVGAARERNLKSRPHAGSAAYPPSGL